MTQKSLINQFSSFLGVGAIATVCHYILLVILVEGFDIAVVIASTAGALLGAIISYFMNYMITFNSMAAHKTALPKFLCVAILAIVMNMVLMKSFIQFFDAPYLIAQCVTTAVLITITFGLNKVWSFKE